jgi:chromosome segregation ATPase
MTDLNPWLAALGVIIAAALASIGTLAAARWSHRNEQVRLRNELVTILGHDRDSLSEAAEKARARANEVDSELELVRDQRRATMDELAATKIAHREAVAEMTANHRTALEERDSQRRQVEATLSDVRRQLAETERELARCRDEVTRRGNMIDAQASVIAELRARFGPIPPSAGGTGGGI